MTKERFMVGSVVNIEVDLWIVPNNITETLSAIYIYHKSALRRDSQNNFMFPSGIRHLPPRLEVLLV